MSAIVTKCDIRECRNGERACGKGLRGIPNELLVDVPRAVGEELLDAEVAIVEEDGVGDLAVAFHLLVEDPPPHAVKVHGDDLAPLRPADGAILGVVFHNLMLFKYFLEASVSNRLSISETLPKSKIVPRKSFDLRNTKTSLVPFSLETDKKVRLVLKPLK